MGDAARRRSAPAQVLRTDSTDLIRRFVLGADALNVLPADVVYDEIDAGKLVILNCDTPAETTRVGLIYRLGSLVTPQVRLLADRIKEIVAPGFSDGRLRE